LYPWIREQGLNAIDTAVQADKRLGVSIQAGLGYYEANDDGLYRLVIGRFWQELPPDLPPDLPPNTQGK
jgi:hypothetical protein